MFELLDNIFTDSQHPKSILKMKDKSTKCIRKKVHFEGEADLTQPLTQTDRNQGMLKFFGLAHFLPVRMV